MEKLEDSKTLENLREAFLAEASLAYRLRYFAIVAEFEGLDRCAGLFRELAESEETHVHGCLDFLRSVHDPDSRIPIGGTRKNLDSILQTTTERSTQTYPDMAKTAREEGFTDVASWFDTLEKLQRHQTERVRRMKND